MTGMITTIADMELLSIPLVVGVILGRKRRDYCGPLPALSPDCAPDCPAVPGWTDLSMHHSQRQHKSGVAPGT